MSDVTNVILRTPLTVHTERNKIFESKINSFFDDEKGFVYCDDDGLPSGWYGGTRFLEVNIWIGAFNYLYLDELEQHLKQIDWGVDYPEWIQLIVQRQEDNKFSIIEWQVFPSESV